MPVDKKFFIPLSLAFICVVFLPSCSKRGSNEKDKIIAYVNKEPVYESDVKRGLAYKARLDPNFTVSPETYKNQIDSLIDKKLIIQEALNAGLAREERFVNTIKTFWEQTLIRDFLDYKKKELTGSVSVSDAEIKDYHRKTAKRVTFKIFRSRDKKAVDGIFNKLMKDKAVLDGKGWKTIGPVGYADITSKILFAAFDLPAGGIKQIKEGPVYYCVTVTNVEPVQAEPLEAVKPGIIKRIIEDKERQLFEDWLNKKRAGSKIEIK